jgi:hypothetical protein
MLLWEHDGRQPAHEQQSLRLIASHSQARGRPRITPPSARFKMPVVIAGLAAAAAMAMVGWNVATISMTSPDEEEQDYDFYDFDQYAYDGDDGVEDYEHRNAEMGWAYCGEHLQDDDDEQEEEEGEGEGEGEEDVHTIQTGDQLVSEPGTPTTSTSAHIITRKRLHRKASSAENAVAQLLPALSVALVANGTNEGPMLCRERELAGLLCRGNRALMDRQRRKDAPRDHKFHSASGNVEVPQDLGNMAVPIYGAAA